MASLTSRVITLYDARESAIAALQQLLEVGRKVLSREDVFGDTSLGVTLQKGPLLPPFQIPSAPSLEAAQLLTIMTDVTNRGFAALPDYVNFFTKLRVGDRNLSTYLLNQLGKEVLQGPVDIVAMQLDLRALSQDSGRYWFSGRRRIRSSNPES